MRYHCISTAPQRSVTITEYPVSRGHVMLRGLVFSADRRQGIGAVGNRLAHQVLGRSLDELPPQTRRLLHLLGQMVAARCEEKKLLRSEVRFSRREARESTGWSNTQLRVHLGRLEELEYLVTHRGGQASAATPILVFRLQGSGQA